MYKLGRLRARSIAGLFSQPPSEPDLILIASSGSPVSVSLRPWRVMLDVLMTPSAERYALTLSGYHELHPERHLPFTLFVQVF
jgi:hypothetical protein